MAVKKDSREKGTWRDKRIHTGAWLYKYEICDMAFKRKDTIKQS